MFNDISELSDGLGIDPPDGRNRSKAVDLITDDFIGVEIELENAHHLYAALVHEAGWNIHDDGSLRNNGKEFTFRVPYAGKIAEDLLKRLSDTAAGLSAARRPARSARTSVHVHVDCTDMTTTSLSRMLAMYMVYEKVLFKAFAIDRLGNHFALPFNDIMSMRSAPRSLSRGWEDFSEHYNNENNNRYCALNLKALFKFGTVEFRHHGGEYNYDDLINWINTCLSFKRAGKSEINLREMFFMNSAGGFVDHTKQLFPPAVSDKLITCYKTVDDFNADVIEGIRVAQCALSPRVRF